MGIEAENVSTIIAGEEIKFGKSIPVDSVQEIVRKDPENIPEIYLREMQGSVVPHLSLEIPVIDLSLLSEADEGELSRLDIACREWGFFQVINHGISPEVLQNLKSVVSKFFELPFEQKKKYSMATDDIQGYGQLYVVSEQQKLDWADVFALLIYPMKLRNMSYWPSELTSFAEAVEVYSMEANRVSKELISAISKLMGMEKDELWRIHNEVMQAMRVNYYPTCCNPDKVVGVSPHSDSSTLTVLLQDDEVTGLQVRHHGGWVPVKPIPNALVLNVGDALEVFSNGRYKSIEHRAMTNKSAPRISIASFICPQDNVELMPPDAGAHRRHRHKPKYKKIAYGEYLRSTMRRKLNGKSNIELIKLDEE
ncbi:uncharacterized protein A4U43_C03F31590 [Asparagus officinalis]|uniref:Fe2OG dioxygenase domain-containing protein n=1 Tax=Asparagus officinalis TaxID=4686 RepID=A0A5P1FH47_ASPOF|nr:uncharacterized protein A4U43_C03F31590 [Asparagus officinalis]